jgi:hypothetical protein
MSELTGQAPHQILPRERKKIIFNESEEESQKLSSLVTGIEQSLNRHLFPLQVSKNTTISTTWSISKVIYSSRVFPFLYFWNKP